MDHGLLFISDEPAARSVEIKDQEYDSSDEQCHDVELPSHVADGHEPYSESITADLNSVRQRTRGNRTECRANRPARIAHDPQHVCKRHFAGCGCFLSHLAIARQSETARLRSVSGSVGLTLTHSNRTAAVDAAS
jgi:hypothetical protein